MRAYTLIEAIAVIIILGIVSAIGVSMMNETAEAWFFGSRLQSNAVSSAMVTAQRMSREIRALRNDTFVFTANATTLTFNPNSVGVGNTVFFSRTGNTLMRRYNAASDGLLDSATALNYTYYNDNEVTIATPLVRPNPTNIRRIVADISITGGGGILRHRIVCRPQNVRRLNEKFK